MVRAGEMLQALLTVAGCSRKYQMKVSHGTPPPAIKRSASSSYDLFYHGSLHRCFASRKPESVENISFDDAVAILKENQQKKCDDFPVAPLGAFRFCHFNYLAYRDDSSMDNEAFIPIAFHSRHSDLRPSNGTIAGQWVHNQAGEIGPHNVTFVYACDQLASQGYVASVRRPGPTQFDVRYHCSEICPFDPNRQVIYPIRCYPKRHHKTSGRE
jgi:hypothetical protein